MENNGTVLAKIVQQTARFRDSRASCAPGSIFEVSFATQSIHRGDRRSLVSSTRFPFDDEVMDSRAYRRALAKPQALTSAGHHVKDAESSQIAKLIDDVGSTSAQQLPDYDIHPAFRGSSAIFNDGNGLTTHTGDAESTNSESTESESIKSSSNESERTLELTDHGPRVTNPNLEKLRVEQVTEGALLSPTPYDRVFAFVSEKEAEESDSLDTWTFDRLDIKNVDESEVACHKALHEIIITERRYLQSLELFRFAFKYPLSLDGYLSGKSYSRLRKTLGLDHSFPGCEDIHHANKTLLFDPLTSRQSTEGPWLPHFLDTFRNWMEKSGNLYVEYASQYYAWKNAIRLMAVPDSGFLQQLEKSCTNRFSRQMTWQDHLHTPVARFVEYKYLLAVLEKRVLSGSFHQASELREMIRGFWVWVDSFDAAFKQGLKKVEPMLASPLRVPGLSLRVNELTRSTLVSFQQKMLFRERKRQELIEVSVVWMQWPKHILLVLEVVAGAGADQASPFLAQVRVLKAFHIGHIC